MSAPFSVFQKPALGVQIDARCLSAEDEVEMVRRGYTDPWLAERIVAMNGSPCDANRIEAGSRNDWKFYFSRVRCPRDEM